ncbi:MAG TPA: EpsI family protein [Terriglobales bacterium]|jgi:EpsI family protein
MKSALLFTAALLGATFFALGALQHAEEVPSAVPLSRFPPQVAGWSSVNLPLDPSVLAMAGVHDYLNRRFTPPAGQALELYVGYYPSQRTGDTIHSPKNCLPGGGWVPLQAREQTIAIPGHAPIRVNDYAVAKGADQAVVLYWYQGRGRVIASEYAAKWWMATDALERHRTDGALVRIWVPVHQSLASADEQAAAFARLIYPRLAAYIPN